MAGSSALWADESLELSPVTKNHPVLPRESLHCVWFFLKGFLSSEITLNSVAYFGVSYCELLRFFSNPIDQRAYEHNLE